MQACVGTVRRGQARDTHQHHHRRVDNCPTAAGAANSSLFILGCHGCRDACRLLLLLAMLCDPLAGCLLADAQANPISNFALDVQQTKQVFTSNFGILLGGFCAFEAAIGAYWPLVMKLRSDHLGEAQRAAVTSLFRVPLNLVVCLVLMRAGFLSLAQEFCLCVGFLVIALACQRLVVRSPV